MIEICKNLYIGNEQDYEIQVKSKYDWRVVHACKEPYHRALLGYKGRGAPKDHLEYLIAERGNQLFLNLIDADSSEYIPKLIIDKALEFISKSIFAEKPCLVHCNQGESRAPSIGLLYLVKIGEIPKSDFSSAKLEFLKIYPYYKPKRGIQEFIIKYWNSYTNI